MGMVICFLPVLKHDDVSFGAACKIRWSGCWRWYVSTTDINMERGRVRLRVGEERGGGRQRFYTTPATH